MTTVNEVCTYMESIAPLQLADDWDNVGLLVGDPAIGVHKVMTCLTITPQSAIEAVEGGANLILTHHPLPFHPLKRLTTDDTASRLLMHLIKHDVSVYSSHTAFDSASLGINQMICEQLGLLHTAPLIIANEQGDPSIGSGRMGTLPAPISISSLADNVRKQFGAASIRGVLARDRDVYHVGVACGSGGSFLSAAREHHCDTFVTGEASFHSCLEAAAVNINLLLIGHFASEKFAIDRLADLLEHHFPGIEFWSSKKESDPIGTL